jgi:hypothetical protein
MRNYPYFLIATVALLAACSDWTGPDLSATSRSGTPTAQDGTRVIQPHSARKVEAK